MIAKYFFNDIDAYAAYGILFQKGAFAELLSMPGAWPNETRSVALPIVIKGEDEPDYWVKYNAFRSLITSGEEFTLLANDLHRRFKLSYISMSSFTMLTPITGGNKVYCDFVLNLEDNYPDVKMYTRTGSFTKAGTMLSVEFKRTYSSFTLADATALGNADTTFIAGGQAYANASSITALDVFMKLVLADGGTVDQELLTTNYYE